MRYALPFHVFNWMISGLASAASLTGFHPEGSIKKVSQVQARFDSDMVDFGSGRAPSPFQVDCAARGEGRWLDARTYVHDFVGDLPEGIRCQFTLIQQKDRQGVAISGRKLFSFDTGGPVLLRSRPGENESYVYEDDPLLLVFDAPVKAESLSGRIFFQTPQRADTIGVEMVPDPEKYLAAQWPYLLEELKADPKFYLLVKPKERLPADSDITLVLDKGLSSPSGVATVSAQTLHFKTRPPFRASLRCEKEKAGGPCAPQGDFMLSFSDMLAEKDRARIRVFDGGNKEVVINRDESSVSIPGPHPAKSSYRIEIPKDLKDERGRELVNASEFPLTVRVGDYGPLLKFPGDFGLLEAAHPVWPLNMRRVEGELQGRLLKVASEPDAVLHWYKTIQSAGDHEKRDKSIFAGMAATGFKNISLKKPNGPDAFEVIGVPLPGPGFYVMEVGSERLGAALLAGKKPMYARASVLVTNLAVHVTKGRQGSPVWVTSLDQGRPVAGAEITISDCKGRALLKGRTDASGLFQHPHPLPPSRGGCYGLSDYDGESSDYMVTAGKDDDFGFTLTHWTDGIESWRFQLPSWDDPSQDLQIHTVLDRTLFRRGETVSMLHVARRRVKDGLALPRSQDLQGFMSLQHIGSDKRYKAPVTWSKDRGNAEGAWRIAADAPLGWYAIMIGEHESGRFRVDEFRPATMKGRLQAHEGGLIAPKLLGYDFDVSYLSGGPASHLPLRLRRSVQGAYRPHFAGYESFDFDSAPIDRNPDRRDRMPDRKVDVKDVKLNKAGTGTVQWEAPRIDQPTRVLTEMEFSDANGEARTVALEHQIWPSAVVIGMKSPAWQQKGEPLNLSGVTLDTTGRVVPQQKVTVRAFKEDILSHRRRGVGGTYIYEHRTEIKELGVFCETRSDAQGLWSCQKPPAAAGTILLQAEAKDGEGRPAFSQRSIWVAGERLWFMSEDHDRIDLIPEKRHYEIGEVARIQVKMPFSEATVLMTTERSGGILDAKVVTLDSRQPFLQVPIPRAYAPNVFVSAWAVRGRVKGTEPLLKVDLGKPSHKLGITELKVGRGQHTLDVKVQADKPIYGIREMAEARIEVKAPDGRIPPPGAFASVAVVDEALLELMGNASWDLLSAMMSDRGYGLEHATSTMHVLGKRHFGLKALPQGGGGGSPTREIFDTLILWQARVPLQDGRATVKVPLKDNLSSFRIVAVAQAGTDLFGTGSTAIQTRQDISLIAGLPPLVRAGDRWQALVTVRNRSQSEHNVRVTGRMGDAPLPEKNVKLKAGASELVSWDLEAPAGVSELQYTFNARADQGAQDALRFVQQVIPVTPLRVLQASLMVLNKQSAIPVALPDKADPARGGIDLRFSPGPGPDVLQGTRLFFQDYPYTCLEQKVSQAVGLDDRKAWERVIRDLESHRDADGLLKYFPMMRHGSMTLTSYVLSLSHEAGLPLPKAMEQELRGALQRAVAGEITDHEARMPGDQLAYRKIMALEALTRFAADEALLIKNLDVRPEHLPHASLIDLVETLSRYSKDAGLNELKEKAVQQLQARLRLSGTQYGLAGEEYNQISSLLSHPDGNAARLLLLGLHQNLWNADHARMMEGLLRRQTRGAWSNTVANAWGSLVLKSYVKSHPPATAQGRATVSWEGKTQTSGLQEKDPLHLAWPAQKETLVLGREGQGEVWATALFRAAVPVTQPFQAGYRLEKNLQPLEQKVKGRWSRGDVIKVSFRMEAGADQTWVVLADPIPAGARILQAGLRDETGRDAAQELSPAYVERRHEGYFAYFDFMPRGGHSISYVMQVNNPGLFQLSGTRLEAMYAADQYAELPNAPFQVD